MGNAIALDGGTLVAGVGEAEIDHGGAIVMLTCLRCSEKQERPETCCQRCGYDPNIEG